jgi:hypothetical protein
MTDIHRWIEQYILLALRIDRQLMGQSQTPFVDHYYGPQALKARVACEPQPTLADLRAAVLDLADTLSQQSFTPQRSQFLEKHLRAMESMCRLLDNQRWNLRAEIQNCLDIEFVATPDIEFERVLRLLDSALPGKGSLRERYASLRKQTSLSPGNPAVTCWLVQHILAEARQRAQAFLPLPADETLDLQIVQGKPYGAANWYLGNYRSRLELNADRPIHVFSLIYQMCHEAYPGHHTEFALKEQHLFRQQGCTEQCVFILGPQLVIAEGIASEAVRMIFTPGEIAAWAVESLLPELDLKADTLDWPKYAEAAMTSLLDDMSGNLALLLQAGQSTDEVVAYALDNTPYDAQHVRRYVQALHSPLSQLYALTYAHGKKVVQQVTHGDNPKAAFRRLLTEQVYPSLLLEWQS